ncbi:MAG: M4 family metallopeptidase [Candidatus Nitrosotenuis sp.]
MTYSSEAIPDPPQTGDEQLIDQLKDVTSGRVEIAYHSKTGYVRFIGTDLDHPIPTPSFLPINATPEDAARDFLTVYGGLFGLVDQSEELKTVYTKTVDRGRSFVRFQQLYNGIPVLGAELNVQTDAGKNIISVNGKVVPKINIETVPQITLETAKETAIGKIAKVHGITTSELLVSEPELWIYNPIMLKPGRDFNSLVWRMEVTPKESLPIRELVLVDAQTGIVALHFNQIDFAKNRMTYTANNTTTLPGTLVCNESNPNCTGGDTHAVNAHVYAGDTYDFYNSYHGRDSINNAGMTLISTVHYDTNFCNAFWNGSQMVYGDGCFIVADDVVGHELTHGVTQYESHLFYYYQSGAINESFSDVWGEFVDLTNGKGNDASGVRWLMGEDTSIGAIRSMNNPPAYNDPDRIGSTLYYCGEDDNGGVHTNSGVNNKAAYLMTDGGTFNGKTVTGLGITKVAKIYYEAQTNLLLSASDYNDLYNLLQQACTNLIGTSGITPSDCQEVKDAVDATEMNQQPSSCSANEAPICGNGEYPVYLFYDNLENPSSGNWIRGWYGGYSCSYTQWFYPQNQNPYNFDATYATSGIYNFWGYDFYNTCDYYIRMNLDVTLPAGSTPYMHFNHAYSFENPSYDGGVVEYSTNGGSNWNDAGSLFINNGYTGTISSSYGNPLGGRNAFVGESHGYYSSRLNLSSLAGQNVRFRFRIGTDSSVGDYGWFIDDIKIYTCNADTTSPTGSISINGGAVYTNTTTVTLSLSCSDTGSGCYQMRFSNDLGSWSAWEPYASTKTWVINSGQGSHDVDVQFKDKAGNVTTEWAIWDSITLDTISPTGSISINGGAVYTNTTTVTLSLSCSDTGSGCYQMRFSNDMGSWSAWEPYASTKTWVINSGQGSHDVNVQFKDNAGNVTTEWAIWDSITLDTISPIGSISINGGAVYTNTTTVTLSLSCSDTGSGCYQMRFSNDLGSWSAWEPYASTKTWVINSGQGSHDVDVQFKDNAGNVTTEWAIWDSITLDTISPTDGTLSAIAGDGQVSLSWSGFSDATSGIGNYKLVYSTTGTPNSNCTTGTQIYYGAGTSYTHTGLTNGTTYYYRVCAIDNAGNTSSGATASAMPLSEIQSLIIWYYNQILGRDPDAGGLNYWTSEIERAISLGICVNEGFIVLGKNFFNSQEYLSLNKTNTEYVTDLYWTFLHRAPDAGGLSYWVGQLGMGLPRNIVLDQFIFSQEFQDYMGGIFGYCSVRPEYVMVTDLYRGFLWRLPDNSGFNYWLGLVQDAQCNADPQGIRDVIHQMALDFTHSQEYANRDVDNSGFVVDEYDAFLRRGGDYAGYQYWVDLLNNGSLTRDEELNFFVNSTEFQTRVQQVIDAGCAY